MTRFRAKRPSPALVISILAFFVALGGSAYAASKIGTKQIKNNAITAAKIKKNAVTGAKIKNGTITGAKIKLSSLGTVPSATNAGHASSADSATNATNFSRYQTTGIVKATLGQTVTLLTSGPFTITGHCSDEGSGNYYAYTTMTTNQAHSSMAAYETSRYEADFEPGEDVELSYGVDSDEPETSEYSSTDDDFMATSGDGKTALDGTAVNYVHYFGSPCAFWVTATNGA